MDVSSNTEVVILSPKDVTSKSKDVKLNGSRAVQMLLSRCLFAAIPLVRTFDLGYRIIASTMNRYAHARRDSAVKGIKALDEAYNL